MSQEPLSYIGFTEDELKMIKYAIANIRQLPNTKTLTFIGLKVEHALMGKPINYEDLDYDTGIARR